MAVMTYLQAIAREAHCCHPEPRSIRGEGSAFFEVSPYMAMLTYLQAIARGRPCCHPEPLRALLALSEVEGAARELLFIEASSEWLL